MAPPIETMQKLLGPLCEQLGKDPGDRDEKALGESLGKITAYLESDEARGYAETKEMTDQIGQLRKDIDAQTEELRRVARAGLATRGGEILIPRGRSERREMLADGRVFMSDETAKRFGGYVAGAYLKLNGLYGEAAQAVKEIHESVLKDWEVSVDASGGYTIPDEFRAELIRNVEAEGRVFVQCRRIPLITVGSTTIPKRTAGLTAYWTAPSAQGTRTTPTFDLVTLTPEKLMALTAYPNEFLRGHLLIDIGQFIGIEMVYAMSYAIDDAVVNGDGSSTYGGITGIMQSANITAVAAASTHTTVATLDGTDISNVVAGMTVEYGLDDAKWGMSVSVKGALRALRDTNGNPLYRRGGNGEPNTIDDYPYTITPRMVAKGSVAATDLYSWFGDLRKSHVVGMLRDIAIERSEHVAFESDMTVVRGVMHLDVQEQDANAVVTGKTAAS